MTVWVVKYQRYIIEEYEKIPVGEVILKVFTDDQEAYAFRNSLFSGWTYDYEVKVYKGILEQIY